MHYILSLLIPGPFDFGKRKELQENGFISLNALLLRNFIGPESMLVMGSLLQNGVIDIDEQYIVGKKNRGYRISQGYFIETVNVLICNTGMRKKHYKRKKEREHEQKLKLKKIPYLLKWLNKDHVTIDVTTAHNFIETYRSLMLEKWKTTVFSSEAKKTEAKYRVINRSFYQIHVAKTIAAGIFQSSRDSAGRFYSPIVHLTKELRSCILLNGEKTGSIDVKASQPYLFQMLLKEQFWKTAPTKEITLYNTYRERYKQLNDPGRREDIIMMLKRLEPSYGSGLQNIPFKKFNWESDFYMYLGMLVKGSTTDENILKNYADRKAVKKTMMLVLYDVYDSKNPPYYQAFKEQFPGESSIMDTIKYQQQTDIFPTILQSVEAKLILEICCKKIDEQHPNLPILTIHDSVLCQVSSIETIKKTLENSLTENVGRKPGLSVELMDINSEMNKIQQTVDTDWYTLMKGLLTSSAAPKWMLSFNEEPKEMPLQYRFVKVNGKFRLEKRMIDPNSHEEDWQEDDSNLDSYPNEHFWEPDRE